MIVGEGCSDGINECIGCGAGLIASHVEELSLDLAHVQQDLGLHTSHTHCRHLGHLQCSGQHAKRSRPDLLGPGAIRAVQGKNSC
jgi:hypothetical protein